MEINENNTVTYTLTLTEQEKEWLKGLMQNPLYENEEFYDQDMRYTFWSGLGGKW